MGVQAEWRRGSIESWIMPVVVRVLDWVLLSVCLSSYVDLWVLVLLQITKRKVKSAKVIKGQLRSFILSSLTTRAEV